MWVESLMVMLWQFVDNDGADDEYAFYDMDTST
jgi:hypothetical protein